MVCGEPEGQTQPGTLPPGPRATRLCPGRADEAWSGPAGGPSPGEALTKQCGGGEGGKPRADSEPRTGSPVRALPNNPSSRTWAGCKVP